jgi:hypothetical protein
LIAEERRLLAYVHFESLDLIQSPRGKTVWVAGALGEPQKLASKQLSGLSIVTK